MTNVKKNNPARRPYKLPLTYLQVVSIERVPNPYTKYDTSHNVAMHCGVVYASHPVFVQQIVMAGHAGGECHHRQYTLCSSG